jgi:hypothetical protein
MQNYDAETSLVVRTIRISVVFIWQTVGNRLHRNTGCSKVGHVLCPSINF